jgi:hypothetical protein
MPAQQTAITLTVIEILESRVGETLLATSGDGRLWVWTPVRHRPHYVCALGVTHDHWWAKHLKGGTYPRDLRCEHEVIKTSSPQLHRISAR